MGQANKKVSQKFENTRTKKIILLNVLFQCYYSFTYRLDWQMWFAALGSAEQNPWFISLVYRILQSKRLK